MERITAAGNTEIPAFLVLREAGFDVTSHAGDGEEMWFARKGDLSLSAPSPLQLLGLFCMRKERGSDWKAPDSETDSFLKRFYPSNETRA